MRDEAERVKEVARETERPIKEKKERERKIGC